MADYVLTLFPAIGEQRNVDPEQRQSIISLAESTHPSIKDLLDSVEARLSKISH
jgi:hypothetical protein